MQTDCLHSQLGSRCWKLSAASQERFLQWWQPKTDEINGFWKPTCTLCWILEKFATNKFLASSKFVDIKHLLNLGLLIVGKKVLFIINIQPGCCNRPLIWQTLYWEINFTKHQAIFCRNKDVGENWRSDGDASQHTYHILFKQTLFSIGSRLEKFILLIYCKNPAVIIWYPWCQPFTEEVLHL